MVPKRRMSSRCRMISCRRMSSGWLATSVRSTSGGSGGAGMSAGAIASRHAATTMFEHAAVVTAKVTVIDDRHAVRNVGAVIEKYGSTVPGRSPSAETPAKAGIHANRDSRIEGESGCPHDTRWRRQYNKAWIGDKQRSPDFPRIVVGNVNQSRIDGNNLDQTRVYYHTLLRRRN